MVASIRRYPHSLPPISQTASAVIFCKLNVKCIDDFIGILLFELIPTIGVIFLIILYNSIRQPKHCSSAGRKISFVFFSDVDCSFEEVQLEPLFPSVSFYLFLHLFCLFLRCQLIVPLKRCSWTPCSPLL